MLDQHPEREQPQGTAAPQAHYPESRKARLIFATHWTFVAVACLVALLFFPQLAAVSRQDLTFLRPWLRPMLLGALLCAAWYFYSAQAHAIISSAAGLRYRRGSYTFDTPWENIVGIARHRNSAEALLLREPASIRSSWWSPRRRPADVIPLAHFPGWRAGSLGRELRRYRPALFEPGSPQAGHKH